MEQLNRKKNVDFSAVLEMYGDDLPCHTKIPTGDIIDVLLDTAKDYPNVVPHVKRVINAILNPTEVQTDAQQYDILLWFNNKIVLCYEDNDFHEVELKVAKPVTKALKKLYEGLVPADTLKLYKLKEKLLARKINQKMQELISTKDSSTFLTLLNELDFDLNKEINIKVQGED